MSADRPATGERDIVERLRAQTAGALPNVATMFPADWLTEAADEIARLRKELAGVTWGRDQNAADCIRMDGELVRLRRTQPAETAELFEIINECWGDDGPQQDRALDIVKALARRTQPACDNCESLGKYADSLRNQNDSMRATRAHDKLKIQGLESRRTQPEGSREMEELSAVREWRAAGSTTPLQPEGEAVEGWRPIETAPKDQDVVVIGIVPTHWMPLPDPPALHPEQEETE